MSHHLKVLAGAGLVETRREGNSIFYRRSIIATGDPLTGLLESFYEAIDRMPLSADAVRGTNRVHDERAARSRQFFEKNADRLKDNQNLVAEFTHYRGCVRDLLSNEQIPGTSTVLEIGPGESDLINILAERFRHVTAIDNSREMLDRARRTVATPLRDKVEFIHGVPEDFAAAGRTVDLLVLNMVLHHLPSPARLFRTARQLLNPDGRLLVIDLRPHDQDWAREICGDLWLGFEPGDLDKWAQEARLEKGQSVYLGLNNGFQVQVRLFQKHTHIEGRHDDD